MAGYAINVLHTQSNAKISAPTTCPEFGRDMRIFLAVGLRGFALPWDVLLSYLRNVALMQNATLTDD